MAFLKYARATVVRPVVTGSQWSKVRVAAQAPTQVSENLIDRATKIFGHTFDPNKYLLSHATIVSSVDTYAPSNTKLGRVLESGFTVNRKYADFRVTSDTDKYLNNNLDGWSRPVLLLSFPTFISGHNFVEHVQVEDLSKGRIIDAVSRDLGDTIYVDILIATDLKHTDLIEAIRSGKMSTLSMGCQVDATVCTKCGHVAADETEMCYHIKHEKGNTFFDEQGRKHRVAELCGHESIAPNGGVKFIEASWVENPAFTGAVLRNIISIDTSAEVTTKAAALLSIPPEQWTSKTQRQARQVIGDFMAGWDDEGGGEEAAPSAPKEDPKGPFEDLEGELTEHLKDRVKKKLKKDMDQKDLEDALGPEDSTSTNETIVKEGRAKLAYQSTLDFLCRHSSTNADLLDKVARLNAEYGIHIPVSLYRAALLLGNVSAYKNQGTYIKAGSAALGRQITVTDLRVLLRLGKIISRWDQDHRAGQVNLDAAPKETMR